jgi:hypothetical protein
MLIQNLSFRVYRFTGLLLATKLLPAGDAAAVKAVHDAVGIAFVQRLLFSLSSSQVRSFLSLAFDVMSACVLSVRMHPELPIPRSHAFNRS